MPTLARSTVAAALIWAAALGAMAAGPVVIEETLCNDMPALSPDGKTLASWRWERLRLLEATTGKLLHEFPKIPGDVKDIVWTADGKYVVSYGEAVTWWDVAERKQARQFQPERYCSALAFSPDGKRMALGFGNGGIQVCPVDAPSAAVALNGHQEIVRDLLWRDRLLFSCGGYGDGTVRVWQPDEKRQVAMFQASRREVLAMALHPEGRLLLTLGDNDAIVLRDAMSGELVREFKGARRAQDVAFVDAGKSVLSSRGHELVRWDETGVLAGAWPVAGDAEEIVRKITVSGDERRVAAAGGDFVRIWPRQALGEAPEVAPAPAPAPVAAGLGTLANWEVVRGEWQERDGRLVGGDNSRISLKTQVPNDLTLRFRMKVVKGMRPRVRFGSFHFGNEGFRHQLFLYGTKTKPEGTPFLYRLGDEIAVEVSIAGDQATLTINGDTVATAQVARRRKRTLMLEGSDDWRPGQTEFHGFELLPGKGD